MRERKLIDIRAANFDDVLAGCRPRLRFSVANKRADDDDRLAVELSFRCLDDFEAASVARQIEPLHALLETRASLSSLQARMDGNEELRDWLTRILTSEELAAQFAAELGIGAGTSPEKDTDSDSVSPPPARPLFEQLIEETRIGWDDWERDAALREVSVLIRGLVEQLVAPARDADRALSQYIWLLDKLLTSQLDEVLHHPEFQQLEASWRGLQYLVMRAKPDQTVKIRVMNVSKEELRQDLERSVEFDQSVLFKKIHEEEYGVFGGTPYAVIVGDYAFDNSELDVRLLEKLAGLASAAHAPFIASASPKLFGFDDFRSLKLPRDLSYVFRPAEYDRWRAFRTNPDARYAGLVLPRFMLRAPYTPEAMPVGTFRYEEDVAPVDHEKYLWGNAAYAFTANLAQAFHRHGWCAAIRGYQTGGLLTGLPLHRRPSDEGDQVTKCPTEVVISDRRHSELANLGFIALCHEKRSERAVFFSAPSCAQPVKRDTLQATADAQLAAGLEFIIPASRFAHYLKVLVRDGARHSSPRDCEAFLREWIARYVQDRPHAAEEAAPETPLQTARLEVSEARDRAGVLRARLSVQPRYQLPSLREALVLTIDLPPAVGN